MKADNSVLTNESGEIEREYDKYYSRLENCKSKEDVDIEWALHWARLNLIKKKYNEHEKEIKEKGIDFGRVL